MVVGFTSTCAVSTFYHRLISIGDKLCNASCMLL